MNKTPGGSGRKNTMSNHESTIRESKSHMVVEYNEQFEDASSLFRLCKGNLGLYLSIFLIFLMKDTITWKKHFTEMSGSCF